MTNLKENGPLKANMETLKVGAVTFLGEQRGTVEQELKSNLSKRFETEPEVIAAYLIRVRYQNSNESTVALCLKTNKAEKQVAEIAATEFRAIFKTTESLDIMFIGPDQERQIWAIARPFYERR